MMAQFTVVDFVMRLLKIILFAPVGLSGFLFLAGLCSQSFKKPTNVSTVGFFF